MNDIQKKYVFGATAVAGLLMGVYLVVEYSGLGAVSYSSTDVPKAETAASIQASSTPEAPVWPLALDMAEYDKRMLALVDYAPPKPVAVTSTSTDAQGKVVTKHSTSTPLSPLQYSSSTSVTIKGKHWPTATPYPQGGAILPFKRILAYYGNFYSRAMGILGELEPQEVLAHLAAAQAKWEAADPTTPVMPAIEYIASVAQASAGADGMYRAVMPEKEIEKAYALAQQIHGILILDIQVGLSPLRTELPKFKKYLERPEVHFAIDPEFSMKGGEKPGTVIGTFSAADINYTINYLAQIVRDKQLPPKVLIVHRFTQDMVTGVSQIKPQPEVQVVMVMDGWGPKANKFGTYSRVIEPEPVQFTGLKIFYKNDLKPPSTGLLTPADVLKLNPKPIYIQYQ